MKKIYYLSSCNTCIRIMSSLGIGEDFIQQDLKSDPINREQLEKLFEFTGNYEALFNKRARLYKERNLKEQTLSEEDYKALILEHYTFLKRPVVIIDESVFVGNSKSTVEAIAARINEK